MSGYAVVIEQADGNLSAYLPDLPGCVATGATEREVRSNITEAVVAHPRRAGAATDIYHGQCRGGVIRAPAAT